MARRLIIDCGAADTRAALLDEDEALAFWFGPAHGDEALPRQPQTGDRFIGRLRTASRSLGGSFVDIGADRDGFLPGKVNANEGALVSVTVRRPPIDEKGSVLVLNGPAPVGATIGPAAAPMAAAFSARSALALGDLVEIRINDPEAARLLGDAQPVRYDPLTTSACDFDDAIADSLAQRVTIEGGARLHFAETEAGVMIDIDSAGASGVSADLVNDSVNKAALARLPGELGRRGIGGRIVIDFLPPSGAAARSAHEAAIAKAFSGVKGARLGRLQRDGLFDLTMPKPSASLLLQATEEAGGDWPVKGRRFTLDWAAKAAIRVLEKGLRGRPTSQPKLVVGAAINAYLFERRAHWIERLKSRYGARFKILLTDRIEPRGYDLVE